MAKVAKKALELAPLCLELNDPGMTPMLRTGLGGLAASLFAISRRAGARKWPVPVELGGAIFTVEPRRVVIDWGPATDPEQALRDLFDQSFTVDRDGLIGCLAWHGAQPLPPLAVRARLQAAIKRTFLQHGKSTTKKGSITQRADEIDDQRVNVSFQPYSRFAHQSAYQGIVRGLRSGTVALAGWAYPGAIDRHLQFKAETRCEYTPAQAFAACFAVAGSVCYETTRGGGGVLVMLVPDDLQQFARARSVVTPKTVTEVAIAGVGDAVLLTESRLRAADLGQGPGVARTAGVLLRATPWAQRQKSRVALVAVPVSQQQVAVSTYEDAVRALPARVVVRSADNEDEDDDEAGYFVATSSLRAFIADNLASGRRWFDGFWNARTPEKKPRLIHQDRDGSNLGALFLNEKKGLVTMVEKHLDEAELALVRSVHVALRQRFGAIAEESSSNPATMKNRMSAERDKWRLAFAGAKTQEQVRSALADLWSRAGPNRELQRSWEQVLALLRADRWQAARDLALVGLASYQGKGDSSESNDNHAKGAEQ